MSCNVITVVELVWLLRRLKPRSQRTGTNRSARQRSDNTSAFGQSNDAFILEDLSSSSYRRPQTTDAENNEETGACTSDHRDTDDDGQSVENRKSSSNVALLRTNSSRRTSIAAHNADCDNSNTTCAVIERSTSMCDFDDGKPRVIDECNIVLQQSTAAASVELTSAEFTSTTWHQFCISYNYVPNRLFAFCRFTLIALSLERHFDIGLYSCRPIVQLIG